MARSSCSATVCGLTNRNAKPGTPNPVTVPTVAVASDGTLHIYTRSATNGDLYESYAPLDGTWTSYDMTTKLAEPKPAGQPAVALTPDNAIHLFTRAAGSGDVVETYAAYGKPWAWYDATTTQGLITPASDTDPVAAVTPDGTAHVYTRDAANGDLIESYAALGKSWSWQDMTTGVPNTPKPKAAPSVAVVKGGAVHLYTVDATSGDLYESFASLGGSWSSYDMSTSLAIPRPDTAPVVLTTVDGTLEVFTRDASNGDLDESYAGFDQSWHTYDMTVTVGTPSVA